MAATGERDALRARVAAEGLTPAAAGALTPVVTGLSLEQLGPVKQLLKRFFSDGPWGKHDDAALADAVGPGPGEAGRVELAPGVVLSWGWDTGRFRLDLDGADGSPASEVPSPTRVEPDLDALFAGTVVPEVTPSPRTIRFATPRLGDGPSRDYTADTAAADPRVERVFASADSVTGVLVGPDFVAVTILHADRWEQVLGSVLRSVEAEFVSADDVDDRRDAPVVTTFDVGSATDGPSPGRVERAWSELGALRADRGEHLDRILAASRDDEPARRQVAAALVADAPPDIAARAWSRLATDRSRAVRRSALDAIVDARREDLRPILEAALADRDGWVRWKAVHGLAVIGIAPSRAAVMDVASDPDFRVRLEATRALAG